MPDSSRARADRGCVHKWSLMRVSRGGSAVGCLDVELLHFSDWHLLYVPRLACEQGCHVCVPTAVDSLPAGERDGRRLLCALPFGNRASERACSVGCTLFLPKLLPQALLGISMRIDGMSRYSAGEADAVFDPLPGLGIGE